MFTEEHLSKTTHLVGVCGVGMTALAELLDGLGWPLSGSDLSPATESVEELIRRGLIFYQGHGVSNLHQGIQRLVYSPAVEASNPERMEAARRGIQQYSYSQMAGWLMKTRQGICIAGTHGKSTTTAMIGWILTQAGRDPSVLIGASLNGPGRSALKMGPVADQQTTGIDLHGHAVASGLWNRSGWAGDGDLFVVESCEFRNSFLDFEPRHAVILGVEPDHFDCFADLGSLRQAFDNFAQRVSPQGLLLVSGDCQTALECAQQSRPNVITFGRDCDCDWRADEIHHTSKGVRFRVVYQSRTWAVIRLSQYGVHNAQNALAAVTMCAEIGLSPSEIIAGLGSFPGLRRRFEDMGQWQGITWINDYAHHPTAVRATLAAARQRFGTRRIVCLFQPHQVSRTIALIDDFEASFDQADMVLIVPVYAAREQLSDEHFRRSQELVKRIASRGVQVQFIESLDRIMITVDHATRPGDVLIAMGAGDLDKFVSPDG